MKKSALKFKTVIPEYKFSSRIIKTKKDEKTNYMHVIACGDKLDKLQELIEQHLEVISKKDMPLEWGNRDIKYTGKMQGIEYQVIIKYGACPTLDGGMGHNIEIKTVLGEKDELSSIIAEEMKKYEAEMTKYRP
jgi:hypothetical protein